MEELSSTIKTRKQEDRSLERQIDRRKGILDDLTLACAEKSKIVEEQRRHNIAVGQRRLEQVRLFVANIASTMDFFRTQTLDQKTSQHEEETCGARAKQTKLQLECIEQELHSRRRELQSVSAAIGEQVRMWNTKRIFVRHLMQTEYLGSLRVQAKRYRKSSRIYLERIHALQQEIRHHETQLQKRAALSSTLETLNRQIDTARENLHKTLAERDRLAQVIYISFEIYDIDDRFVIND